MEAYMKGKTSSLPRFSLIELLIVVAIIGILLSILLPALGKVKAAGQRISCAGNLRQLGLTMSCYLNDWNGSFPRLSYNPYGNETRWFGKMLDILNVSYASGASTRTPPLLLCPADSYSKTIYPWPYLWYSTISYGYNHGYLDAKSQACGGTYGQGNQIAQIKTPSNIVLLGDNKDYTYGGGPEGKEGALCAQLLNYGPSDIHSGKPNILYCDMHADSPAIATLLYTPPAGYNRKWWGYGYYSKIDE